MKKNKIFIILSSIVVFLLLFSTVYAYFITQLNSDIHDVTLAPDNSGVVEVETITDFYQAIRYYDTTKEDEYNSGELSTSTAKRKTIKLLNNITLTAEALVTADCHIDLNTHSIDLNGYDFKFKHMFDGLFTVYGGSIIDSSTDTITENGEGEDITIPANYGRIIIDCPNACVDFNKTTIVGTAGIEVLNASTEMIANSAMKLVYSNLISGVNNFYTTSDEFDVVDSTDLCTFDHSDSSGVNCCYTYDDLDFVYRYYTYAGIEISYESSDENIVDRFGNVNSSASATIDLTVIVSYNGEEIMEKVITVHVLEEVQYAQASDIVKAQYAQASNIVLLNYLQKYYNEDQQTYIFDKSFLLPKGNDYFNTSYTFTLNNGVSSGSEDNDFFDSSTYNNYYLVGLNKSITSIRISSTYNGTTITSPDISVQGQSSSNLDDNYSYAINIVSDLYGNQLLVKYGEVVDGEIPPSGYTEYKLLTDYSNYSRLTGLEYSLVNNNENTYEIVDYNDTHDLFHVDKNNNVLPYISQTVFLAIKFTFKAKEGETAEVITIQIPVVFVPQDSGAGFDAFDPYYVYFNKEFITSTTNGYTYNSFEIPMTFKEYPTYTFFIYRDNGDGTYEKMIDGELFTLSNTAGNSFEKFDVNAQTIVTINPYYIPEKDSKYVFLYIPIYKNSAENGVLYHVDNATYESLGDISFTDDEIANYAYISKLTIPGIVRYESTNKVIEEEAFNDKELYEIAYELLNGKGTYIDGETFILTSSLTQYISSVDFSTNSSTSLLASYGYTLSLGNTDNENQINSLKGLDKLTGINSLTFSGTSLLSNGTLNVDEIEYISQITYLTELNLGNTGIYDQTAGTVGFPQGDDNEFLTILSNLTNLERLYLNNNKIYDFNPLQLFTSLKYVNVSNNSFTVKVLNTGITALDNLINNGLTDAVNSMYGSNGSTNAAVFAQLQANEVEIVGYGNGQISPEVQTILNALSSLEYQDRVSNQIPIQTIYSQYSTQNIYNLPNEIIVENAEETTRIRYILDSITFGDDDVMVDGKYTAKTFSMYISYSWTYASEGLFGIWSSYGVPDGMTQADCVVTYRYQYHVTRY